MSVFTVVNVFSPGVKGGGPSQSLSNLLRDTELEVRVFTGACDLDGTALDVVADQWINWSDNSNIKVFYSSKTGYRLALQLFKEIGGVKPSVVWVNSFFDFKYSLLPQLAAGMRGSPIVISPRGELMEGALSIKKAKKIFSLYLLKMLYRVFTPRFHFTSEEERTETLRYLGDCDTYLFPNYSRKPMSTNCLASSVNNRVKSKKLIFLARLVPKKGLDIALRVLAELDQEYGLEIYGEFETPHYECEIKELVRTLELFDRVIFRGFIPFEEALSKISACQLMLAPTRGENFGHSIYECLSIGLPVVISDQTPWKNSLGLRVCLLDDIECYVKNIIKIEKSNAFELAENALHQAQAYYDTLPAPTLFLKSLETGAGRSPPLRSTKKLDH
jgi:glycosyltransferase involved in cell wall biosynthesis